MGVLDYKCLFHYKGRVHSGMDRIVFGAPDQHCKSLMGFSDMQDFDSCYNH